MRIVCVGGGPAGLYFAIQMMRRDPSHRITVIERNRPYDTFGWGVVFSDETLRNLEGADPPSKQEIIDSFAHWDDIDIHFKGRVITSGGHGFCGIERKHLLNILQHRAEATRRRADLRARGRRHHRVPRRRPDRGADGVNSRIRTRYADHFKPRIDLRHNKFVWLGTHRVFAAFTFIFVETEYGGSRHTPIATMKTPRPSSSRRPRQPGARRGSIGRTRRERSPSANACSRPGSTAHPLLANMAHLRGSPWISFPRVANETWVMGNVVLMGDAAHSAHFSIGSGTKLALEDAIALARAFDAHTDVPSRAGRL